MNPPQIELWRAMRRCLVGLGLCVTLIGFFYTEELWRGKRAWNNCKRALQAQGVDLNWADYIPPEVPENENIFSVPEMQKWFVGRGGTELSKKLSYPGFGQTARRVVAELTIGLPGAPAPGGSVVLRWDDSKASTEAARLLSNALGPTAIVPQGLGLMLRRPEEIQAARIFLQCQTVPTEKELGRFLSYPILATNNVVADTLKFEPDGGGSYHVTMAIPIMAADYLAWSDQLEPQFAIIRQALQRPLMRMDGNYAHPAEIPIPNFVTERAFAQTLGARAQCHLLLGQPGEALRDLTLMHDSGRIMAESKPMTLVAAMINVAVRGIYADAIADGMRLHAWHEPQLAALEEQLKQINLLPPVRQSVEMERVGHCYYLETEVSARMGYELFKFSYSDKTGSWTDLKDSVIGRLIPRGWVYHNIVAGCNLYSNVFACMDSTRQIVFPDKVAQLGKIVARFSHWSPYTFIVGPLAPNFSRALQTTAKNQTMVNQALIACALERYHLAHGEYPESLEALAPQFLDNIPHDVIGGNPLHYRRAADGTFLLYSVGWNGRDDGGVRGKSDAEGDWVWPI